MRAALLIAAAIIAGCAQAPARPSTTYDVVNYSVAIPDDLGVEPPNPDLATFWMTGFNLPQVGGDGASLMIRVRPFEALGSDSQTARTLLEQNVEMTRTASIESITTRDVPAGSAAQVHWSDPVASGAHSVDVAYLFHDGQLVTFTAGGMSAADLALIVDSFRFRDPPGDPLHPPSNPPVPSG